LKNPKAIANMTSKHYNIKTISSLDFEMIFNRIISPVESLYPTSPVHIIIRYFYI